MATLEQQVADLKARLDALDTPTTAALHNQMATLLASWQAREDEYRAWQAGTSTGGPNGDGYYPMSDSTGYMVMKPCIERMAVDARAFSFVKRLSGVGPYTMATSDVGKMQLIGNGSNTADIQVRLPTVFAEGAEIGFIQMGSGKILFRTQTGGVLDQAHRQNFSRTAGISAFATAIRATDASGNLIWKLAGDMIA